MVKSFHLLCCNYIIYASVVVTLAKFHLYFADKKVNSFIDSEYCALFKIAHIPPGKFSRKNIIQSNVCILIFDKLFYVSVKILILLPEPVFKLLFL